MQATHQSGPNGPSRQISAPPQAATPPLQATAKTWLPSRSWQRQGVISGITLAATVGGGFQLIEALSPHEGYFELSLEPETPSDRMQLGESAAPVLPPPQAALDEQIAVAFSPESIAPVIQQLKAQDPDITHQSLMDNLEISRSETGHLLIRYRHQNADYTRQVLQLLAEVYSSHQACVHEACTTLEQLNTEISEIQQRLRTTSGQIQTFESTYDSNQLAMYQAAFEQRLVEINQQKLDLGKQLSEFEIQLFELKAYLSIQSQDTTNLHELLNQDLEYQNTLQQLVAVEQNITHALTDTTESNQSNLQALYEQYNGLYLQLNKTVEQLASRPTFMAALLAKAESNSPQLAQAIHGRLLHNLLNSAHHHQILTLRQQTLLNTETLVKKHIDQLSQLVGEYNQRQQALLSDNQTLAEALQQRSILQQEITQSGIQWTLVEKSEPIAVVAVNPWVKMIQMPLRNQKVVLLSLLLGGGLLTALARYQPTDNLEKPTYAYFLQTPEGL